MNISTFGDELMNKRLDRLEEEIKKEFSDDKEEREFRIMKVNELRMFVGVLWLEFKKAFLNESPWFLIRDDSVENITLLTKTFTDVKDPEPVSF